MPAFRLNLAMLVIAILLYPTGARAQSTAPSTPTKEQALSAIASLSNKPLDAQKRGDVLTIMRFAETSDDVLVSVDSNMLPFLADSNRNRYTPLLLASFVGGNVKSQLDRGVAADDSYAGLQSVLKTYGAIRKVEPGYVDPLIDKLDALEKDGKLQAYVADAKAKSATGK